MPVESSNIRAIIWNEAPSGETIKTYFNKNFKIIQYDKTYEDLTKKNFDYTGQYTLFSGRTWEKFIFIRVENEFITLFLSYTMQFNAASIFPNNIERFFSEVSKRMLNKLFNPEKSLFSHRFPSLEGKSKVQYFLVKHDSRKGFSQEMIPSIEDGLKEQQEIAKKKQSSCIVKIQDGQTSLHSIQYSINPDLTIPDFNTYCETEFQKQYSTIHNDL